MGKRLYVGNLPYDADEDAIRTVFAQAGNIERVHIPLDRETQRPRGFAFVEMSSDEEAAKAVETLNGSILGTRTLRVSEAEERRPPGGGARGGGGYDRGPRGGGGGYDRGPRGGGGGDYQRERSAEQGGPDTRDHAERAREARQQRFGPDAKPSRDRRGQDRSRKGQGRRRNDGFGGGGGGRGGGGRRYDEDDF